MKTRVTVPAFWQRRQIGAVALIVWSIAFFYAHYEYIYSDFWALFFLSLVVIACLVDLIIRYGVISWLKNTNKSVDRIRYLQKKKQRGRISPLRELD